MDRLNRLVVSCILVVCSGAVLAQRPPGTPPAAVPRPSSPAPTPPASAGSPAARTGTPSPTPQPNKPKPLPGLPVTPPPVDHPALVGQPLMPSSQPPAPPPAVPGPVGPGAVKAPAPAPVDPDTAGPKLAGKDLDDAVAKVLALRWSETMSVALAAAKATDKPVLWLQTLGELDGLACSTLQSLRGITFSNDLVLEQLRDKFVLGRGNIERELHVGLSHGYRRDQTAFGTTNGTGGRNVQMVFLAADGAVLHVLPGFWHPLDLLAELQLVHQLHGLYGSGDHAPAQKLAMAATMHRAFLRGLSGLAVDRSRWQDADALAEQARGRVVPRDTFVLDAKGQPLRDKSGTAALKPLVQVVHERSMVRAFVPFGEYDIEAVVDYGTPQSDANAPHEKGRAFAGAVQKNQERERAAAKAAGKKGS
jgi:hypothetical protein